MRYNSLITVRDWVESVAMYSIKETVSVFRVLQSVQSLLGRQNGPREISVALPQGRVAMSAGKVGTTRV